MLESILPSLIQGVLHKLARAYLWSYVVFCLAISLRLIKHLIRTARSLQRASQRGQHVLQYEGPGSPYYPLRNERIRLLKLRPGRGSQPLNARLFESSNWKTSYDSYEALSYAWGTDKPSHHIFLNGEDFYISGKLYQALKALRHDHGEITLYVDALCINQVDLEEKNTQVALMGDVYKAATRVINWLGPATRDTKLGFEILSFLFGSEDISKNAPWSIHPTKRIRAALNDILKREYLTRIWTVQETALAWKITLQSDEHELTWLCGVETHRAICRIKYTVISPAWETAGLNDIDFGPLLELLEQNKMMTRIRMRQSCREVTVLDLAYDLRRRKATDPRDMLFALRNMVPNEMKDAFVVDYSKSVEEVYAGFFEEMRKAYEDEMAFAEEFVEDMRQAERARKPMGISCGY